MVSIPRDLAQKLHVNTLPGFLELWETCKYGRLWCAMTSIVLILWVWEVRVLTKMRLESIRHHAND